MTDLLVTGVLFVKVT